MQEFIIEKVIIPLVVPVLAATGVCWAQGRKLKDDLRLKQKELEQALLLQQNQLKSEVEAQEKELRKELIFDVNRIRTDFMAEQVARRLLTSPKWERRSFAAIKRKLGGFEDNDLRRLLVRAGAVRFVGKNYDEDAKNSEREEYWGLIERNQEALKDDFG